jgi:dipeptidyl aminopeptidase/acylaminoacyl peptidase
MLRRSILALALLLPLPLAGQYKPKYTVEQFLSPPFPLVFASAKSADRIAWVGYDRGKRNIYTAAAPSFAPVKLTAFDKDDGQDITAVEVSDDGSTIVFVRGTNPNNRGWVPNPDHTPDGAVRAIWAVKSIGGSPAVKLIDSVTGPQVSPDGKQILYLKDGQIYRARFPMPVAPTAMDKGDVPFIKQWGSQNSPRWSPDGSKIVFVSDRGDHSYIGLYDVRTRTVSYPFPGVDRDAAPSWSQDGKRFAFTRRPGSPFGATVVGVVGAAGAAGSAAMNAPTNGRGARGGGGAGVAQAGFPGGGRGGRGGGGGGRGALVEGVGGAWTPDIQSLVLTKLSDTTTRNWKGMFDERFADGSTLKLATYTLATNQVKEFWTNDSLPPDPAKPYIFPTSFEWQGDVVVFRQPVPNDDWDRFYAIKVDEPGAAPINLIKTDGMIEGATSVTYSADGKTMYYCTNATDIEHRHIWAVPTSGGEPVQLTKGDGIHTSPLAMGSGKYLGVLYADAKMPELVAVLPTTGGKARVIEKLPAEFPMNAHVVPEIVYTNAADGVKISNELFLPADLKSGEKRPAIIFVHGGSQRQMLPGYHYMQFYHESYAVNQWLASQGYVVMSINYRTGIGYGNSFRAAKNSGARGNSEYLDVLAGGKYLQSRADVDPGRIGIWGLSYGGDLASQALARNSDMFVAGADLAGVHLWGNSLNPQDISFQSSTISAIDKWKSPVFLVQGDDDRNVAFTQMMGLVHLLRQRNVYYDLTIIPDDLHESMIHSRWVDTWDRMGAFFHDYVWEKKAPPPATASVTRTVPR